MGRTSTKFAAVGCGDLPHFATAELSGSTGFKAERGSLNPLDLGGFVMTRRGPMA